ncbi:MAG: hypothetical protein K6E12_11060 [Saccharofermentans sp.]|nr:hypothetical protein [Saccharofermentans sp.]
MKKFASFITVIALTASLAGCALPQESGSRTSDTTEATTTSETVFPDDSDPTDDTTVTEEADSPASGPVDVDFEPADRGLIIPCVRGYLEDNWTKENNIAYYSFVTLDGELVCNTLFDWVYYAEDAKTYIVRHTDSGVSKYGFISDNGAVFTGLIYDGAAVAQGNRADGVCFYGSTYEDGKLWVSGIGNDLNVIDTKAVTIDEEEITLIAEKSQLSVLYTDDTSTVMINRSQFYYKTMLIDNASGKLLGDLTSGFRNPYIFGNVIISLDMAGEGLAVYDMLGNQIIDDEDAYAGFVTDDLFLIAQNNELTIYDTDWQEVNSMSVPGGSMVKTSFGRIAVADGKKTQVYDKDLVLLNTFDYSVDNTGTYLRDWYDYGEGDIFYDTITGNAEIINLNTGAILPKEDMFAYTFKYGYIVADNKNYGNAETNEWHVYDADLNLIVSGEGFIEVFRDDVTGDVYMVIEKDGLLTVYSLPDGQELFSYTGSRWTLEATDGRFHYWDTDRFVMLDGSGEEIVSFDVDYRVTG